jgi:hypothetical protein
LFGDLIWFRSDAERHAEMDAATRPPQPKDVAHLGQVVYAGAGQGSVDFASKSCSPIITLCMQVVNHAASRPVPSLLACSVEVIAP